MAQQSSASRDDIVRQLTESGALFDRITGDPRVATTAIRITYLVDCYGDYHRLLRLFEALSTKFRLPQRRLDLDALGELALSYLGTLGMELQAREARRRRLFDPDANSDAPDAHGVITAASLLSLCRKCVTGKADQSAFTGIRTVIRFENSYQWFFAPFPKNSILGWLEKKEKDAWKNKNREAMRHLQRLRANAARSIIEVYDEQRDYSIYETLIRKLAGSHVRRGEEPSTYQGEYKFFISGAGIKYFSEKQVDMLICMRAMDCLHERSADTLCIISSDTDFMPLIARYRDAGCGIYQSYAVPGSALLPRQHRQLLDEQCFIPVPESLSHWETVAQMLGADLHPALRAAIDAELDEFWREVTEQWEAEDRARYAAWEDASGPD